MNFIAVDLKIIEVTAPALARAMGDDVQTVLGALALLWHRCWSVKSDIVSKLELRGYFAHADAGDLLEAFGLLERIGETWRVKGADRYLRLSEQRRKAGEARARTAGRGGGRFTSEPPADNQRATSEPPAADQVSHRTPNTEHRTPKTDDDRPPPVERSSGPLVFVEPTTPSHTWSPRDFFAWAQTARQRAGWVAEQWPRKDLGRWWSEVQMTPGMEAHREGVDRLRAGFLAFAQDPHWRKAKPPVPFQAFMARWRDHVPAEIPSARVAS